MKFMDLLRKLGIFRSGAVAGTYTDAKERPSELQMEGVLDAKKDLVSGGETKSAEKSPFIDEK